MIYDPKNIGKYQIEVSFSEKIILNEEEKVGCILMTDGAALDTMSVVVKKNARELVEVRPCQEDQNQTTEMILSAEAYNAVKNDTAMGIYLLYYGFGLALMRDFVRDERNMRAALFATLHIGKEHAALCLEEMF